MAAVYEPLGERDRQPPSDLAVAVAAAAVALASVVSGPALVVVLVVAGVVTVAIDRRARLLAAVVVVALGVVAAHRSAHERAALAPDRLGPYTGWAMVVDESVPSGSAARLVLEVEGERFEVWVRRHGLVRRVEGWAAGSWVRLAGERHALEPARAVRVASQHVVGRLDVEWVADVRPGSALARSADRVRGLVARGASFLPEPDAALLRGLVIGDDRDQPREMIERFRASGLSHLTAVSGQNIAFVIAAASLVLTRLRPVWRWCATVGLVAWFVVITRVEPSVVRAGVMAVLSATAFVAGRERTPVRLLALAVVLLLLVDPLLVRSVGFWLSVGATAGVSAVGPWLVPRLRLLGPAATPVAVTLGAQVGVALPSLLVFGRLPLVSLPANLLAVPVAGLVMLVGLPATLLAGAVPAVGPIVTWPLLVGVRWVDAVASVGAAAEPSPGWGAVGWVALVAVVGVAARVAAARNPDRDVGGAPDR